ncbi:3-alpha-hydroxysteroid dehydrogenase [Streptomyces sp. 150FB]|uniref:SDR family NAD(P)-dependent oxidoreductase n=1 Tax=Streptomyces sp. 150FB TaxID=1576605 RepID=UPI00058929B5|nr:glucose 1-dehydrogenase [Streptomyces sp. 150FB]KIF78447.1 3-alpha-hydroxysteroid dehydrogenase [Streptomyces sp. 150FB]
MNRVQGKTAIVTGGASGIGAATARTLAAEGADVVIGDINTEAGNTLAGELGSKAVFVRLDVTSPDSWNQALTAAQETFGGVDILVNNVGLLDSAPLEEWDAARFQRSLNINLFGVFNGVTAVIPFLKQAGGGSIINIGSSAGLIGYPAAVGYVSSKWAVRGLTKTAAVELGKHGIRVNAVHPGQINTPATANATFKTDHVALKRLGEPEDVAQVVLFLAGDESRWISGADYSADGGEFAGNASWDSYPEG